MITQSKSFDHSLEKSGICIEEWDNIVIEISNRLIHFHAEHDEQIISKSCIYIPRTNDTNLLLHLICKQKGIELSKIEPCFDFQRQVEVEFNSKPRLRCRRKRCRDDETRQMVLSIFS